MESLDKLKKLSLKTLENKRYSWLTNNMDYCYLCGKIKNHKHEIFYGKNRKNSMIYGMVIPLCNKCHDLVHNNIALDNKLKKEAQVIFEEYYDIDFLSIFRKNYK